MSAAHDGRSQVVGHADLLADAAFADTDCAALALGVDTACGLPAAEAARRRAESPRGAAAPGLCSDRGAPACRPPPVGLLLGACAVSTAVGDPTEAAVILAIVVLDALLRFA